MTQSISKSDQAVFNLLAAAKKTQSDADETLEVEDYDWNVPSRFTPIQLDCLDKLVAESAKSIARELGSQLHQEAPLWAVRPGQHYAGRLDLDRDGEGGVLFVLTTEDGSQCGVVKISAQLANLWIGKALGGSPSAQSGDREFSTLESALLRDVVVAVVHGLAGELRSLGGRTVQCGSQAPDEHPLGEVRNDDEYCLLAFRVDQEKDNPAVSFVLSSDMLEGAVGGGNIVQPGEGSPTDSQENMRACVDHSLVTATVSLMTTELSLRDALDLEVGDVLMADNRVDQPLELLVGGAVVLSGYPVTSDGQYALQITR